MVLPFPDNGPSGMFVDHAHKMLTHHDTRQQLSVYLVEDPLGFHPLNSTLFVSPEALPLQEEKHLVSMQLHHCIHDCQHIDLLGHMSSNSPFFSSSTEQFPLRLSCASNKQASQAYLESEQWPLHGLLKASKIEGKHVFPVQSPYHQ
jgi:hypothetical protein